MCHCLLRIDIWKIFGTFQILIQGRSELNRAVDGDVVAVELLPENMWSAPSEIVLLDDEIEDEGSYS